MSLIDKLKKGSTVKTSQVVSESEHFKDKDLVATQIPALNIALSGSVDGGLASGLTVLAGPSKMYKSNMSLVLAKAYMDKYPESICLLYDTEFGITPQYLDNFDIDKDRVLHTPIEHVEQLKFDIVRQLENVDHGDRVFILVDSIGNLASKKELEDALDEKSVADMTRAKALKGLFRMVTPYLNTKNIPLICVNHTYKEIGLYPKDIMSGGTGIYYSSNQVFFISRRQNKEQTEVVGYDFVVKVEKSRFVREGSKIPITVTFSGGIDKNSGLFDIACTGGFIVSPSKGFYQLMNLETGEVEGKKMRKSEIEASGFYDEILKDENFKEFVESAYKLDSSKNIEIVSDDEVVS